MDNFSKLRRRARIYLFGAAVLENAVLVGTGWGLHKYTKLGTLPSLACGLVISCLLALALVFLVSQLILQPLKALWQIILHLNPTEQSVEAPKIEDLRFGRELVANLSAQVYQLSTVANTAAAQANRQAGDLAHNFIAQNLPLPLIMLDQAENIKFVNEAAARYIGLEAADMTGKNVYAMLDMSFPSDSTFDSWLKTAKVKSATATMSWARVRLNARDDHPVRLFDLAAYYNRDNPEGNATMLVLFDHTKEYSQDEQAISFMALSVHELRTPLTLLRGYIEVFEDEIGQSLTDPELHA